MRAKVKVLKNSLIELIDDFKKLKEEKARIESEIVKISERILQHYEKLGINEFHGIIKVKQERWEFDKNDVEKIEKIFPELVEKKISSNIRKVWDLVEKKVKIRPKVKVVEYLKLKGGNGNES